MAYQGQQPQGFGLDMAKLDPLTMKDVEARQANLDKLGLGDGWLGQLNQWSGKMVGERDALHSQVKTSLLDKVGLGVSKPAAVAGSVGDSALATSAKGSVLSGAAGAAM